MVNFDIMSSFYNFTDFVQALGSLGENMRSSSKQFILLKNENNHLGTENMSSS